MRFLVFTNDKTCTIISSVTAITRVKKKKKLVAYVKNSRPNEKQQH